MTTTPLRERLAAPVDPLLTRLAVRISLLAASRISVGCLTVTLPDGSSRSFGDLTSELRGEMRIHDTEALRRILLGGEVGGGEAYVEGLWSSPDLVGLISLAVANRSALRLSKGWWRAPAKVARTVAHRRNRNTKAGSRRNITAHYDLGNDFYQLWLDETMTYSSALFESADQSLSDAQRAKYRAIASRAGVEPGMHVLEIGTGWGGMALYLARELGARVTSVTISQAQYDLARERIAEAGLADRVTVELRDYRDLHGEYDAVVSIEMLEAVGEENWDVYTGTLKRCLNPRGRAALQFITIDESAFEGYRRNPDFIQRYVFPGGMLPTLTRFRTAIEGAGLRTVRADLFGEDYARTLSEWHRRFLKSEREVERMGFDESFRRMWKYYLAYCEAGFRSGHIDLAQVLLANE